jgi:signal transduction histidine kinase
VDETYIADEAGQARSVSAIADLSRALLEAREELIAERAGVALERERVARFHDELIRIVGHDLRAPLGAIEVGIEMVANASDTTIAIARISSFTKRLSRIADHVVDLTRVRLGAGIPLARTHTRLATLVAYVVREVAAAYPQHRVVLEVAEDVRGSWDEDRIAQVVRALVTNAAQYGRERGAVGVEVKSHADGAATIAVHNELQGMPLSDAAIATMFDAYRRGSDDAHIGTGVGLSLFLAQQIVRAHRGSISVESSSAGTVFHVVLPGAVVTA